MGKKSPVNVKANVNVMFGQKNEKNSEIFIFAPLKFSDFQKFAKVAKLK